MVFVAPPVRVRDELWFYYTASNVTHDSSGGVHSVGLAILKADRFIARENLPQKEGVVLTRPFIFKGSSIEINASAFKGSIKAELQTLDGKKIAGFEKESSISFKENSLNAILKWEEKESIVQIKEKVVRIKFFLSDASLYAFKVIE